MFSQQTESDVRGRIVGDTDELCGGKKKIMLSLHSKALQNPENKNNKSANAKL